MIYLVRAIHVDRDIQLGVVEGDIEDIKAYFDDRKAYGLKITEYVPPTVIQIPKGYAAIKKELELRQTQLDNEVKELDRGKR
jgi:hypothetical protein